MCQCERTHLSFETLFTDPLIQLVMASDGVSREELTEVLRGARSALAAASLQDRARVIPFRVPVAYMTPEIHA